MTVAAMGFSRNYPYLPYGEYRISKGPENSKFGYPRGQKFSEIEYPSGLQVEDLGHLKGLKLSI